MRFRGDKAVSKARAYVYSVTASMLEAQYSTSPENVEGWMFGGIEDSNDRRLLTAEIKRLRSQLLRRAKRAS